MYTRIYTLISPYIDSINKYQYFKLIFSQTPLHIDMSTNSFKRIYEIRDCVSSVTRFFCVVAVKIFVGETLELMGVLRQEMGTYLCIASNNVPPTVSKRYSVDVHCRYRVALRQLINRCPVVVALHTLAGRTSNTNSLAPPRPHCPRAHKISERRLQASSLTNFVG